jgi:hypothetical protein
MPMRENNRGWSRLPAEALFGRSKNEPRGAGHPGIDEHPGPVGGAFITIKSDVHDSDALACEVRHQLVCAAPSYDTTLRPASLCGGCDCNLLSHTSDSVKTHSPFEEPTPLLQIMLIYDSFHWGGKNPRKCVPQPPCPWMRCPSKAQSHACKCRLYEANSENQSSGSASNDHSRSRHEKRSPLA